MSASRHTNDEPTALAILLRDRPCADTEPILVRLLSEFVDHVHRIYPDFDVLARLSEFSVTWSPEGYDDDCDLQPEDSPMSMSDEDIALQERKAYVPAIGERIKVIGCHSEVMMHFGLAGKPVEVSLEQAGFINGDIVPGRAAAQVYKDGDPYSFPILPSEAGFYYDSTTHCWYCYPDTRS